MVRIGARSAPLAWAPVLSRCLSTPADLYSAEPGEEEPAWVQTEREQFRDFRDLNKDGQLDGSEVGHWVLPPAQDQPLVEANHLLHESDTDKVLMGPRGRWGRMRPRVPSDQELGLELLGSLFVWRKGQRQRGTKGWEEQNLEKGTETQRKGDRDPEREGQRPREQGTGTWSAILRFRGGSHILGTERFC